jgi:hypothetical protein
MVEYLSEWPFKRGEISKIRPSDGCKEDGVPLAVDQWYDFPEFGGYLGNVGSEGDQRLTQPPQRRPRALCLDNIRQLHHQKGQSWETNVRIETLDI